MSLVGPRPVIPEEHEGGELPQLPVRPGLTGLWQLCNVCDKAFDKNPEYDLFYLANRSMSFDLWLSWRTLLLVATGRETRIGLATQLWERNSSWRELVPSRSRSIPVRRGQLRPKSYLVGLLTAFLVACLPGIAMALSARSDLTNAQTALSHARTAAIDLNPTRAKSELRTARTLFESADEKLSSWSTLGLRIIPGLDNNVEVPQAFAALGDSLVNAGNSGLAILEQIPLERGRVTATLKGGTLDLAPFAAASAPAATLQSELDHAYQQLIATPDTFLYPSIADARNDGLAVLAEASQEAGVAAGAIFLISRLFGADGPRNWIIGAENNAELRGRGGYIGSLGVLSAHRGRLSLSDFEPTGELPPLPQDPTLNNTVDPEYLVRYAHLGGTVGWQNLNMSPDFPTAARTLLANLNSVAGMSGDGLITMDPIALSYLLEATGPVDVPGLPEPLTSDNVVEWSLNKIYFLLDGENDERKELLSVLASTVWERLLSDPNLNAREVAGALTRALSERHLVLFSSRDEEQKVVEQLGIGGTVKSTSNDYLLLVGQNVAENKADFYLRRSIRYTGRIRNDGGMQVQVATRISHTAPVGTEFPKYFGGPLTERAGEVHNYLSLFVPKSANVEEVLLDGVPTTDFDDVTELGMRRLGTWLSLAPGESQDITYMYFLPEAVIDGEYRLSVQHQALVKPDELAIEIRVPDGTVITSREGFGSGDALTWEGELKSDLDFAARIEAPLRTRLLDRIVSFMRRPITGTG
jgi:hypothetical protein